MNDHDSNPRLEKLLNELGPADPPAGFVRGVMARISLEARSRNVGPVGPFSKEGKTMTRKAMWGIAAAAAIVLAVFAVKGFPPVGSGSEGTIGAAQKYQAPQLTDKDVVLGDAAAQEFLQSDVFDRLIKDPDARDLLNNPAMVAALKQENFVVAIRQTGVREALKSDVVHRLFADAVARAALEDAIRTDVSGAAARQTAAKASFNANAQAAAARALEDPALSKALAHAAIREALANKAFRDAVNNPRIAAALGREAFIDAVQKNGFAAAVGSARFNAALSNR